MFPSKDNIKKQTITEWEKMFANHISNKGLIKYIKNS